jgi:hypothetical protein
MDTRPSPIAGRWYPGAAHALTDSIDEYLRAVPTSAPPDVVGLVAPHAGHQYSGGVAAHAFAAVRGLPIETVAILCPSHFHDDGDLLTSGHAAYATPLGAVAVDPGAIASLRAELAATLKQRESATLVAIRNDREHAIEIELPFLQRVLAPDFKLIPVMIRDQSEPTVHALGLALAKVLRGQRALVIASSDLSHFQQQPIALKLDNLMLKQIDAFDPAGVIESELEAELKLGIGLACGYGAIAATLWATKELGATQAKVLKHATSGDVSGDYSSVVGYGAAVIWKEVT